MAIKALFVGALSPWLDVTCDQEPRITYASHPAARVEQHDSITKKTLTDSGLGELNSLCLRNCTDLSNFLQIGEQAFIWHGYLGKWRREDGVCFHP